MRYFQAFLITAIIFVILLYSLSFLLKSNSSVKEKVIKVVTVKKVSTKKEIEKKYNQTEQKKENKPQPQIKKPITKKSESVKKNKVKSKIPTKKISKKKIRKKVAKKAKKKLKTERRYKKYKYKKPNLSKAKKHLTKKFNTAKNTNSMDKSSFLSKVRAKIKANLEYPQEARYHHTEGRVEVIFNILPNGRVDNIRFVRAKRVFRKSVLKAFKRVFPLNIPANIKMQAPFSDIYLPLEFKFNN